MSDVRPFLWLIPTLPLAGAVLTTFLGPKLLRRQSHWPCILGTAGACVCAFLLLFAVQGAAHEHEHEGATTKVETYFTWIQVNAADAPDAMYVPFSLRADPLTAIMMTMVTFVGLLIAIYAAGYMHGDPGYPRFFAAVALFVFSMCLLVLADNLVLLYAGWEGVGVCSYMLIGFWYTKPSAAAAARKAFLVTRIGDVGLLLGIFVLWYNFGHHLDYDGLFAEVQRQHAAGKGDSALLAGCLLLFCGAAGKSAQFPLHVWLPDAMEGPTPVSALIHAATMVTAGVYLIARCTPLFALAPEAQLIVAGIGGFTALFAALIALTQMDLKRVLAYSTLSQLGYMFLALGCAVNQSPSLVRFAVIAAVFHLITHAFFKALLFLSAGSVMHAMGGVIDMRRFSGLRRVLPHTHWTFLCGALSLSGFPGFSGFWSKDEILSAAYAASDHHGYGSIYFLLWAAGMLTAALTAFYTFRCYFMTFWGDLKVPPEAGAHGHGGHDDAHAAHDHGHAAPAHAIQAAAPTAPGVAHESPPVMTIPLMILAIFALFIGAVLGPMTHAFEHLLNSATIFAGFDKLVEAGSLPIMLLSSVLAIGGLALAWLMYVKQPSLAGQLATRLRPLYQLSYNKFHIDELYNALIVAPLVGLAGLTRTFDLHVIDSLVDLTGQAPALVGKLFRPVQNGLVQFYALAMVLGLTVFLLALIRAL